MCAVDDELLVGQNYGQWHDLHTSKQSKGNSIQIEPTTLTSCVSGSSSSSSSLDSSISSVTSALASAISSRRGLLSVTFATKGCCVGRCQQSIRKSSHGQHIPIKPGHSLLRTSLGGFSTAKCPPIATSIITFYCLYTKRILNYITNAQ